MSPRNKHRSEQLSQSQWFLLLTLVASALINYVDRGNLSMAARSLEQELALSPLQVGSLLSAFFLTYSLMQIFGLAGWLADRFPVNHVLTIGFLIWSFATVATGWMSEFALIYATRLLLGVGESFSYPCYLKIFATYLPAHHRGRANALLDAGTKVGPALGTALGGILLPRVGWRYFFIVLGLGGLLWLIPWIKVMPGNVGAKADMTENLPSFAELLSHRSAWARFSAISAEITSGITC